MPRPSAEQAEKHRRLGRLPLPRRQTGEEALFRGIEFELGLFFGRQAACALKAADVGAVDIVTFVQVPVACGAGFKPEHLLFGLLAIEGLGLPAAVLQIRGW